MVSFDVANAPQTGMLEILRNTDPIATTFGGALDSFYQSNIDGTTTQNYFSSLAAGLDSFMFSTLGVNEAVLTDMSIYPNPTSDIAYIRGITNNLSKVEIYNLAGQLVLKIGRLLSNSVDFSRIRSCGLYGKVI